MLMRAVLPHRFEYGDIPTARICGSRPSMASISWRLSQTQALQDVCLLPKKGEPRHRLPASGWGAGRRPATRALLQKESLWSEGQAQVGKYVRPRRQ
jgi:hypothetical protein